MSTFIMMTITTLLLLAFGTLTVSAEVSRPETKVDATPINAFACDLYAQLREKDANANLFFSPYSMSAALAMTAEGARGTTAKEMRSALHAGDDLATLHTILSDLSVRLGGKPVPPELREKIASLRAELAAANAKLEAPSSDWREAQALHKQAEEIASRLNALLAQVDQYELKSANALWGEQSFTFERTYLDAVARHYKTGGMFPVDFAHDPDGSRVRINDWVAKQTRDRIKDLLKPGMVRSDTRLVLTNAIYFLGEWSDPFEAKQTRDEDFTTSKSGEKSRVKLMHKWNPEGARYAAFNADGSAFDTPDKIARNDQNDEKKTYPDAGGFLMAELPYKGGDLSMVVLLPRSSDGLAKLEAKLSAANLATWTATLRERKMELFLPKFRLETDYDMNGPLAAMGIKRAFVNPIDPQNGADFSGISSSADPSKQLYIGAVVHKAFVDVNEKGTEAAAATAVVMGAGSAMPQMVPFIPTFRADHPFIFIIRERATGAILFIGRLSTPASS